MVGEQLGRGGAVRRDAGVVLCDLLGDVRVQGRAGRRVDDRRIWSAGTARTEWIAAPIAVVSFRAIARFWQPSVGGPVGVAQLRALDRRPEAAAEVAGVEQRDPDARPRSAASISATPIAFGSSYGVPSGWWCR